VRRLYNCSPGAGGEVDHSPEWSRGQLSPLPPTAASDPVPSLMLTFWRLHRGRGGGSEEENLVSIIDEMDLVDTYKKGITTCFGPRLQSTTHEQCRLQLNQQTKQNDTYFILFDFFSG
jgi:hypothetical protein